MAAITFKKRPRATGLAAVGSPHADVDIKHKGKVIGYIDAPNWTTSDNKWSVRLTVKVLDGCGWEWTTFKKRFDSEADARAFIKNNAEKILKMDLHYRED